MKLAERLSLISAGYSRKEIKAFEEEEKVNEGAADSAPENKEPEDKTDYKTMYEQAIAEKDDLTAKLTASENKIKEIQAGNRNEDHGDGTPAESYLDTLFAND